MYKNSGTVKGIKTGVACRRFWVECPPSWFDHIHWLYMHLSKPMQWILWICVHLIFNLKKKKKKKEHAFFWPQGLWDVCSLTRKPTLVPCSGSTESQHWTTREFWRRPVLIICSSVIQAHQWSDWGSQVLGHSYHRVTLRFMGCPWMLKTRGPRDR